YIAHRQERERQIVAAMKHGERAIPAIVKYVYTDVPEAMHKLAEMSVLAHLEKLVGDGRVISRGDEFELV
ncbi:MAG: MBL fold metallo-hydrolase, partial [Blastocatellia bacterium]|nr:MBL fold metallo-hydrolase [Blastocatellia bacterium]